MTEQEEVSYLGMTLKEAWSEFLSEFVNLQGRSERTARHYTTACNSLIACIYNIHMPITSKNISDWVTCLKDKKLKYSTITLYLDAMSSFIKWATKKGYQDVNPFEGFRRKRPEIPPPRALKWSEATVAIENCYGQWFSERDSAFLDFLLNTGARSSEATSFTLDNLDMNDYKVTFVNTKGRQPRVVYFGEKYAQRLNKYLGWRGAHWPNSPYLFPSRYGGQLDPKTAQSIPRRYGIPWHLHQFRHTFATEVLKRTKNLRLVQILLGHQNIATTARYLQVWDEDKLDAAKALDMIDETQKTNKRGKRVGE